MSKKLNLEALDLSNLRVFLILVGGLATGLCWWIGLTAYGHAGHLASGGVGLLVFLGLPILATLATFWALRHRDVSDLKGSADLIDFKTRSLISSLRRRRIGRDAPPSHAPPHSLGMMNSPAKRDLVLFVGWVAILCWWIGMTAYMNVGGLANFQALVFLIVPVLVTVGIILAAHHPGPGSRR